MGYWPGGRARRFSVDVVERAVDLRDGTRNRARNTTTAPPCISCIRCGSAAPGSRWKGSAASAYDAANTNHRRVIGELAGLDQRLKAHIDQSARAVTAGRHDLDAVRKWVLDAATGVPKTPQANGCCCR
jgi:hypothetical protein